MTDPYALTTYDGHKVDELTKAALEEVAKRCGYSLTVLQGSYNGGANRVSASAGTHDGGGAVDLAPYDWQRKVRAAREVGFAAWHRLPSQGPWQEHIHMILIGDARMSPSAAQQVVAYRNGRDGLVDNARDTFPRPKPIPTFRMPGAKPKPMPSVDAQTASNIVSGNPIAKVKRPRVAARMRQIVARLRAGIEKR